jgi:hypothetical protein
MHHRIEDLGSAVLTWTSRSCTGDKAGFSCRSSVDLWSKIKAVVKVAAIIGSLTREIA